MRVTETVTSISSTGTRITYVNQDKRTGEIKPGKNYTTVMIVSTNGYMASCTQTQHTIENRGEWVSLLTATRICEAHSLDIDDVEEDENIITRYVMSADGYWFTQFHVAALYMALGY